MKSHGSSRLVSRPARSALARAALLAGTAGMLCAMATRSKAAGAVQDLGAMDPQAGIKAMVWLQPHDQAAFAAAVAARQHRGNEAYHRWMSPSELASYAATDDDIATITAALKQAGLSVTGITPDRAALLVAGNAATVQTAFGTTLHSYREANGTTVFAPASEPAFTGAHAEMIAGVTGLSSRHAAPYFRLAPKLAGSAAAAASAATQFTDKCFATQEESVFHQASSVSYPYTNLKIKMTGPVYTATGAPPAKTCGYTPKQVAAHYGLTAAYAQGWTGAGQTIAIVDAYGSPSVLKDANAFAAKFGLKKLDASNFSVVYPAGQPSVDPYTTDWPTEIALDVEWAHALAPDARIVLVAAPSDDDSSLVYVLDYAITHQLGDIVSNSYGEAEAATGAVTAKAFNTAIMKAAAQGIAVNVSTGDSGDFGLGTAAGAASIPADSPYATGVGGTSLDVPSDHGPVETAWGMTETVLINIDGIAIPPIPVGFEQGGGGGESNVFAKPKWQKQAGLPGIGRQLPDVSAIADPITGAIIVTTVPDLSGDTTQVTEVIGGTSLASPVFSAIWALAQQKAGQRLGQAAPIVATMPAGAITDIVPIAATKSNLAIKLSSSNGKASYDAATLLALSGSQTQGFVGVADIFKFSLFAGGTKSPYAVDLGFGLDSSLTAGPGWDNATGFGVPNGTAFIAAAAH